MMSPIRVIFLKIRLPIGLIIISDKFATAQFSMGLTLADIKMGSEAMYCSINCDCFLRYSRTVFSSISLQNIHSFNVSESLSRNKLERQGGAELKQSSWTFNKQGHAWNKMQQKSYLSSRSFHTAFAVAVGSFFTISRNLTTKYTLSDILL
jgi:hypothetical protein